MIFTLSYAVLFLAVLGLIPSPFLTLTILTGLHLLLWTLLCGGPSAIFEIIEARTQPKLPLQPPHPARRPLVVVIGSATGLGKDVVALAKKKKYVVQEGDVLFPEPARHCDLTSVESISKFARHIVAPIDVLVLVAGVCDAKGVPVQDVVMGKFFRSDMLTGRIQKARDCCKEDRFHHEWILRERHGWHGLLSKHLECYTGNEELFPI